MLFIQEETAYNVAILLHHRDNYLCDCPFLRTKQNNFAYPSSMQSGTADSQISMHFPTVFTLLMQISNISSHPFYMQSLANMD
jgi:hypothetical protein